MGVTPDVPAHEVETTLRADDETVHPEAIAREQAAIEDARSKRLRFGAGLLGVLLASAAFVGALLRDNTLVLAGSFLGVLVAGNVIPYTVVRDVLIVRIRGRGE